MRTRSARACPSSSVVFGSTIRVASSATRTVTSIAHALTDALLGAAGLADIGALFPSDDERYRGADSLRLLADAYDEVRRVGLELVNADCVLIGESPRIAPHREAMRARLAGALGVDPALVNVRATTTDRLGFTGRGEGLAAEAVALLRARG